MKLSNLYFDLLKQWCDTMLELQCTNSAFGGLNGAIFCPACAMAHGRCGDAVYPFVYMAEATGDERYLKAAEQVFDWMENVSCEDGAFCNDLVSDWKGITVFAAMALGEAIYYHRRIIPEATVKKWMSRLRRAAEYLCGAGYQLIMNGSNINYNISYAGTMAVLWKIFGDAEYLERAKNAANGALRWFTENRLIFGEGAPQRQPTAKGCYPIDIGYNAEESLPMLAVYAKLTKDEKMMDVVHTAMLAQMEFLLPDGAWDNSIGSRNFKWTYWGSRTSDGCQGGYAVVYVRDPRFVLASYRNTLLLRSCTKSGLLNGGMHYYSHKESPCVHHTFCHAKALALALDEGLAEALVSEQVKLPREIAYGMKHYPELDTTLVAIGNWRATVTAYDFAYHGYMPVSGGSLSLLWHSVIGCIVASSTNEYYSIEPQNQQMPHKFAYVSMTPMLVYEQNGRVYQSVYDTTATMTRRIDRDSATISVCGILTAQNGEQLPGANYTFIYRFFQEQVKIEIAGNLPAGLIYRLPIVASSQDKAERKHNMVTVYKKCGNIKLYSEKPVQNEDLQERIFTYAPGFEAIPLTYDATKGLRICMKIHV